jgi:hypothetical protein
MNAAAWAKRRQSPTSAASVSAPSWPMPRVGGQASHRVGEGRLGGGFGQVGLDGRDLGITAGRHRPVVGEGGLQLGVVELLGAQPALVLARPAGAGAVDAAVAQQEGLQPSAGAAAVIDQVGAGAAQVSDRFFMGFWDADGDQLAGAVQPGQAPAVAPVGLDLVAGRSGDERGRDHLAGDPLTVQQPGQLIAGRAGLIADPQAGWFGEAAKECEHGRLVAGDLLHRC